MTFDEDIRRMYAVSGHWHPMAIASGPALPEAPAAASSPWPVVSLPLLALGIVAIVLAEAVVERPKRTRGERTARGLQRHLLKRWKAIRQRAILIG
jgi:hypothetical protein